MNMRIAPAASVIASVIAVALAVPVYAVGSAHSATPAATPAVCPASSPAPIVGNAAPIAAPLPAATNLPCFAYGTCLPCADGTAQACLIVQCGTQKTTSCGACTTDCVPPPG